MWMLLMIFLFVLLIIVNLVGGDLGGIMALAGFGRPETWALSVVVLSAIFVVVGYAVNGRWSGIFIDERNKMSLSRFQLVLWTALLVSALISAGLSNAAIGYPAPLKIVVPGTIWSLLGLGAFTAVAAPVVNKTLLSRGTLINAQAVATELKQKDGLTQLPTAKGLLIYKETSADADWLDLVRGDQADSVHVDISKLQQLAFTLMLVAIYAMGLNRMFACGTKVITIVNGVPRENILYKQITEFPVVDDGFVALIAISQLAYLGYKSLAKPV